MVQLHDDIREMIARGDPLADIGDALCRRVERALPDVISSLVSVDEDGRLRPVAGPSLPRQLCIAFNGLSVGPMLGACGTAIYTRTPVEAVDIATDPRWTHYAALPLSFGLKACWSTPILDRDGNALGAFALYFRDVRSHTARETEVVEACVDLSAAAMQASRRTTHAARA